MTSQGGKRRNLNDESEEERKKRGSPGWGGAVESRVIEIQRNCPDDDETPKTSIRIGEEKDLRGIGKGGEK